ncbi:nucleotidyltransferase domain-containing protein [Spirosoma daeguense]
MEVAYSSKPLTAHQLRALSKDVKQTLTELYGNRLDRVILYGSYARGDFHAESDVDYMVVLNDENVQAGKEVRRMAPAIGPLALKYSVEVSVFPATSLKYDSGNTFFYQSVQQEGALL